MTPAALAGIHAAAFETPRPWTETEIAGLLETPGCFLCAEPAGFALGRVVLDEAELLTIAVLPQSRRSGLGRALLGRFEDTATARGAVRGFLEVAIDNPAAIGLYRSAGYSQDGLRKGYYRTAGGRYVDAAIYSKALRLSAAD
ncbi:ribosomal protein S18-alanine N-acetyltransferase [Tropicimonas sp. IMCC34043]|uniref:ribosomal protein S18-alanine N-acetyltransferase n=1 Tax=Tropicimonas sp. IMCC34043 TaxID=2248760 RepID=UPI000E258D5F|nr:ribosomal protein S18-alanine N-acetyltransferase [Tropicimonas sp. IMCC34043]